MRSGPGAIEVKTANHHLDIYHGHRRTSSSLLR
uniref:Uncharacterized protein n=1 Tax=Triticum urartu TaxID=4572 RepID=A0A8R7TFY6_TRIUA